MTRVAMRLLTLVAALALPVGAASTAYAQPQLPTCAEAIAAVDALEDELASAQAALVTAEGVLAAETAELAALPAPDEDAVASAQASFDAADAAFEAELPELLEFSPTDYPGDVVPTLASLRVRANLVALLPESGAGSTLGAGAQVEVNEAILAFDVRAEALADLEAAEDAAADAQAAINAQELVVLDAQADVTAARDAVADVDADLEAARDVQAEVCPAPTPTPTDTATPTPTVTATVLPTPTPTVTTTTVPVQNVAGGRTLARTGGDARFPVLGGVALLAAGAYLLYAFRNRRPRTASDDGYADTDDDTPGRNFPFPGP